MPYIGKSPVGGGFHKLDNLTASSTDTYSLTLGGASYFPETANQLLVSLNGVIQAPQDSFTVSGSNLIFDSALTASDSIDFVVALGDVLGVQGVTDGAITTAKIANGAVTDAKIDTMAASKLTGALPASITSSGVYLGGTGSANYLDDYEEGTWTPVISAASGSFTSTTGSGRYTKIGNTVHCWGYSQITNVSGGTNIGGFSGLPFASINDSFPAGNRGGIGIVREDNRTGILAQMFIQAGQPYGVIQSVSGGNMLTPSNNDTFLFEITYKTNA